MIHSSDWIFLQMIFGRIGARRREFGILFYFITLSLCFEENDSWERFSWDPLVRELRDGYVLIKMEMNIGTILLM